MRVVVLSFDGGQMTIDCLESVLATDWPVERLEVVVVDNGSLDDVAERVRATMPQVRILEPLANLGFAGGCNLGMRAPSVGGFVPDFVALVNNDATVDRGWLKALHGVIDTSDDFGAACAKMVFAPRFTGIEFSVAPPAVPDDKGSPAGFCITAIRVDGQRKDERVMFDEGVYDPMGVEPGSGQERQQWTTARGNLFVAHPLDRPIDDVTLGLRLSVRSTRMVTLTSDAEQKVVVLTPEPQWVEIRLGTEAFDVINNVGSNLYAGGFGGDRGFKERDRGQYEEPAEVFAWCGGAVLLRQSYLDEVGLFDERLFLYYEDTDLSWRGRLQGWRYVYTPLAKVRHRHAQSSGVGSPVFRFHTERNRLLMLAKVAPARLAWRAILGEVRRTAEVHWRDLVKRPLTLQMPLRIKADECRRVLFSAFSLLPGMLRDRWMMDRRVSRRSLMKWEVTK